jgi:hypothetical protein
MLTIYLAKCLNSHIFITVILFIYLQKQHFKEKDPNSIFLDHTRFIFAVLKVTLTGLSKTLEISFFFIEFKFLPNPLSPFPWHIPRITLGLQE